ncbi:hypothetical protein D3C74_414630 [compost metagenome]
MRTGNDADFPAGFDCRCACTIVTADNGNNVTSYGSNTHILLARNYDRIDAEFESVTFSNSNRSGTYRSSRSSSRAVRVEVIGHPFELGLIQRIGA